MVCRALACTQENSDQVNYEYGRQSERNQTELESGKPITLGLCKADSLQYE